MFDGTTDLGSALADGSGAWNFTTSTPLTEGSHDFKAAAMDPAGNQGTASTVFTVTVDTTPPSPLTASEAFDDNGGSTNDFVTSSGHVVVSGTVEVGATVAVYDGTTNIGAADVDGSGDWTFSYDLSLGSHNLSAHATDAAGNTAVQSAGSTITVILPVLITGIDPDTGSSTSDGVTSATTITINGIGQPSETVTVSDASGDLGTAIVDGGGHWSLTGVSLTDGSYAGHRYDRGRLRQLYYSG